MYPVTLETHDAGKRNETNDSVEQYTASKVTCRRRGRATSRIPYTVRNNIEHMIRRFRELPVFNIFSFYGRMYNEVLDPEEYGFDYGITELVATMRDTIDIYHNGNTLICRLVSDLLADQDRSDSAEIKWSPSLRAALKDPHFWNHEERKFFSRTGQIIVIDPPPVASLINKNRRATMKEFDHIFSLFDENPYGIPLLQFDQLYFKKYGRHLNLLYFNFQSLCDMVQACPEIFYAKQGTQDVLLYDGRNTTYPDLEGKKLKDFQVIERLTYLLEGRVIQKTLLIVDRAKPKGLPVNIYTQVLRTNFKIEPSMIAYINKLTSIDIFRMMAKFDLVRVESAPECANDLRVFVNDNFDYSSWAKNFQQLDDLNEVI